MPSVAHDTEILSVAAAYREALFVALEQLHAMRVENQRLKQRVRELHEERRVERGLRPGDHAGRAA